jgi:hypothetical protein
MKIAFALLALSAGLAHAQRIPLVDEVIREVSDEIIYDDAPLRRTLKHVDESIKSPLVEEVIRRGSEEVIYGNVASDVDASFKAREIVQEADVSVNGNGMHRRVSLPEGHEKASHAGVPKNETQRNLHFKEPSGNKRERRHRALLELANTRNLNEEVRMLVGYTGVAGKTLIDSTASVVYEYLDEVSVVSCLLKWSQVQPLLDEVSIE